MRWMQRTREVSSIATLSPPISLLPREIRPRFLISAWQSESSLGLMLSGRVALLSIQVRNISPRREWRLAQWLTCHPNRPEVKNLMPEQIYFPSEVFSTKCQPADRHFLVLP